MIGWSFPLNNDGTATGFNDGAIDTFAGNRLSSVVREVIQNSLDARKSITEPVRLCFKLNHVDKSTFDGFHDLLPHLLKCRSMAKKQKLDHIVDYYDTAIDTAKSSSSALRTPLSVKSYIALLKVEIKFLFFVCLFKFNIF